jgi:hypothetical protein
MERPILASEQVYGGLNLDWEEEEEEEEEITNSFRHLVGLLGQGFRAVARSLPT